MKAILRSALYKYIFQYKKYGKYIHKRRDLLCLTGNQIQYNIRDDAQSDTFRNAVHKRHGDQGDKGRNRIGRAVKIDLNDGRDHQETNDDQRRRRRKRWDRQKDGG